MATNNDRPAWLRARALGPGIGVDRKSEVIRGYVIAQAGIFKDRRGEFDGDALRQIVALTNASPNGLKSRLAHPTLSADGVGKFLGRVKNARLDRIADRESEGQLKTDPVDVVRGDLHLDPSSHSTPSGDLGAYVLDLAESDPDAFSSSLVLQVDKQYRIDAKGRRQKDAEGEDLPPLWTPKLLHASDVVDTGDAVDGMLSAAAIDADGLPDAAVRRGCELLDDAFGELDRRTVEDRLRGFCDRYLAWRYGDDDQAAAEAAARGFDVDLVRRRIRARRRAGLT